LNDQEEDVFLAETALVVFLLETVSLGTVIFNEGNGIRKIYRNQATKSKEKRTIMALIADTDHPKSSSNANKIGHEIYHPNCSYCILCDSKRGKFKTLETKRIAQKKPFTIVLILSQLNRIINQAKIHNIKKIFTQKSPIKKLALVWKKSIKGESGAKLIAKK
jgi:hypothetical protein